VLLSLLIILCALPAFHVGAADVQPVSEFNLVFEEIGLMASATDYQLATMKVNLTKLENTVVDFKQTVILQHEFIELIIPIPDPKDRDNQSSYFIPYDITVKERLLRNNLAKLADADVLVYQVQQIKEVLPHMKPHDINEIQADLRGRRSIFSILWGLLGTYRGMMTNRKYDKLKSQLDKHVGLVNRIVNVVNNQGKALDLINQDLAQIRHQLSVEAVKNTLTSEEIFRSNHFHLSTEITRIKNALQCAQWRRLSLDFLSSSQLDSLYQTMVKESKRAETELLVSQPSDLLQLELSYFYNGEMVTFLLHVPTVPMGSLLRLVKLHPFPLPISGNYSIVPDVDTQILAMSASGTELSLQFPAADLLGCGQANHVYLCDKVAALNKHLTSSCLGALYKQQFEVARTICPMKIIQSGEILYRLNDDWQLVYSPKGQTLNIKCPSRQAHKPTEFIPKGISKFRLPAGCRTELEDHFVYSDSSISSDSGLEHIKLPDVVSLNIPDVSPEYLETIMSDMIKDGLYRPTMNDIIEAHEHMEDLEHHSFRSMIVWIIFAIIILFLIAFTIYIFQYLYYIRATIYSVLKLKSRKALYTFISTFLSAQILNPTPIQNHPA
jgi:hypothetical protein